jgi:hypothetical protein
VKYKDGPGVQVSQTIEATGFIDQAADTITYGLQKLDPIVARTNCENQPLVLHNLGAGDGSVQNAAPTTVVNVRVRESPCPRWITKRKVLRIQQLSAGRNSSGLLIAMGRKKLNRRLGVLLEKNGVIRIYHWLADCCPR